MENRRVLITGGSRGIGAAAVRMFASRGYDVAFIYKIDDKAAGAVSSETGAYAIKADISDSAEANEAVMSAIRRLGGIDVLVNNAGISSFSMFCDITDEEWQRMLATNLSGAFYCTRAVLPGMIGRKHGRIINVSSVWGITGASCEVHYSAAKAGLIGMTKALAKELGPSGITVNCVAPGVTDTDMNRELDEKTRAKLADMTPLCRIGTPEEAAAAVVFLASDDASFITGQILSPNGGFVI